MIKAAIHNTIDFTSGINRIGFDYDPILQRQRNIISNCGFLVFEYIPAVMGAEPTTELTNYFNHSDVAAETNTHSFAVELEDSWILFYDLSAIDFVPGIWDFMLEIDGEIAFSECCEYFAAESLSENSIYKIEGYNDNYRYGYLNDTYPGIGFFKVRDLNNKIFGVDKVEFKYSYGRTKILRAENYIKTRLTFCDLTLYQQNLLKFLCNCENLLLDGVAYCLVSDFTERNKDENNEVCDLQAEFVTIEQTFFTSPATERVNDVKPDNLFI
jgi:hypothetical protein